MIIMDQDISEVMPVCTGKEGALQSMYPMKYAEDECSCHICHKVMKIKLRYGQQPYVIGEWHICDTCMNTESFK